MSLSYSALNNYGRATLPSVDSWNTNMNILKDPVRSITTRRSHKVGETSNITEMIEDSSDRACEAITHYARGQNPSVSVSYSNHGSNQGGMAGMRANGGTEAFLPYRVMRDGAFRPPVMRQEQLMPLSRQPRIWTTAFTQPGFCDFSKGENRRGTAAELREVKENIFNINVRPTAVYKIEKPQERPFEVKYVIQNPVKTSAFSGMRTRDITQRHNVTPTSGSLISGEDVLRVSQRVNASGGRSAAPTEGVRGHVQTSAHLHDSLLNASATTNKGDAGSHFVGGVNKMDTERFTRDEALQVSATANHSDLARHVPGTTSIDVERYTHENVAHSSVVASRSDKKQYTSIEDVLDTAVVGSSARASALVIPHATQKKGYDKTEYIHKEKVGERNLPVFDATTNRGQNIYKKIEHENTLNLNRAIPITSAASNPAGSRVGVLSSSEVGSRVHKFSREALSAGGFEPRASMPSTARVREISEIQENLKSKMVKAARARI
jgi:hypothetical protein